MQHEDGYQMFLLRAGKKDPLARHNAVDDYRRQEEAAVKAAHDANLEQFSWRAVCWKGTTSNSKVSK